MKKNDESNNVEQLKKLNKLFGSYRAEWLRNEIFDYFFTPSYFEILKDYRPCVLLGGRGTGKTTVLKGLSYEGQFALLDDNIRKFDKNNFIGIYHRVNTNHVRAFQGGGIDNLDWQKLFSHYFNLQICRELIQFLLWHNKNSDEYIELQESDCKLLGEILLLENKRSCIEDLFEEIENAMYSFQSKVNNICVGAMPSLSMAPDPIKFLTQSITKLDRFQNKIFFFLIDEYENLTDYQQSFLNTLIKHNEEYYTFKIGVRELGWRIKSTLNAEEILNDPADYVLIDINKILSKDGNFANFAKKVCHKRMASIFSNDDFSVTDSFCELSIENEASLLHVEKSDEVRRFDELQIAKQYQLGDISPLKKFLITYWCDHHKIDLDRTLKNYARDARIWENRYSNYKYEMLFKLHRGRGAAGIQKYYAGWNVFIKLANNNIRYFMELVYKAYEKHVNNDGSITKPIDYRTQTLAAQEVGLKNWKELESFWTNGFKLTKLILSLGRIFNVLARGSANTSPEINQFSIEDNIPVDEDKLEERDKILNAAVMNQALIKIPGNKLSSDHSTRAPIYVIHPIFAPFFVFSHRRKRKMVITSDDFLGMTNEPKNHINTILAATGNVNSDETVPEQLELWKDFIK